MGVGRPGVHAPLTALKGTPEMRTRVLASVTTVALSGAMFLGVAAPASAAAPPAPAASQATGQLTSTTPIDQQVTTLVDGVVTPFGQLTGTFTATNFKVVDGALQVTGRLVGSIAPVGGGDPIPVDQLVTTTVNSAATTPSGTCDILSLVLGPLHLDVLGLVVDLNQVVLNITAQSGAGNLLGNLLCSVAGLLDGGTGLNGLAALLNRLLGL